MNKLKCLVVVLILMMSIGTANAEMSKSSGFDTGGLPSNSLIDSIKDALSGLAIISCQTGYKYCSEEVKNYGSALAIARVYLSDPYIEGTNLYVNYKGDGTKYYRYRGITSWSQVSCGSSGCNGEQIGSNEKFLLGSAPSTSQKGVVYVVWDYNSYGGYWAWTWVGYGWFSDFNYNLQLPQPTPSPTPVVTTPMPTPIPTVTQPQQYVCSDGSVVIDLSLCPTQPKVKTIPDFIMNFVNWFFGLLNLQPLSLVESSGININPNTIEGGKVRVEVNGVLRSFSGNSIGVGTNTGDSFKLEATANSGYVFNHWENNGVKITTNPLYGTTTTGYLTYNVYYVESVSKPICDKIGGCDVSVQSGGIIESILAWIKGIFSFIKW